MKFFAAGLRRSLAPHRYELRNALMQIMGTETFVLRSIKSNSVTRVVACSDCIASVEIASVNPNADRTTSHLALSAAEVACGNSLPLLLVHLGCHFRNI